MPRSARVAVGIGSTFVAACLSVACGSASHPSGVGNAGTSSATAGNRSDLNLGGGTGTSDGTGGTDGVGLPDACAADVTTAKPIPLDIYMMLDTSSSMLDATSATISKWDAVKSALEAFLQDDASAGLGVGLQYFPLEKPNAPTSCSSDAECGDSGPCFLNFCYNFFPIGGFHACQTAKDCFSTIDNVDYGPCSPIAFCSNNDKLVCASPGKSCTTKGAGTCTALPESVCENTESCQVEMYAAPAAAIATLPGAAAGLVASIETKTPLGNTPTAPALSGAIQQASTWAKAHPDHRVVTVLATDGLPTQCMPTDIDAVAAIAKAGVTATPSISTFVIGVFGPTDVAQGASTNLTQIAKQGGTNQAFIVDTTQDVTKQFRNALDTIRGARLACQFEVPQPSAAETLDYGRVNVQFTDGAQKSVVYYVADATDCDPTSGGWYYDVDPSTDTPTQIIACPSSCTKFQSAASGSSVGIALGCTTIVK